jgi:hypothetical protein
MAVINRGHEWDALDNITTSEFEDSKTLKAIMFLMIQENVRKIPNDQELGREIRKIVNNFEKDVNSSEYKDLMTN